MLVDMKRCAETDGEYPVGTFYYKSKMKMRAVHMCIFKPNDGTVLSTKQGVGDIYYENGKDYWGFQHIREIADFYDAVENDREPLIPAREALKIQKLICAIYDSGRTGEKIVFD